MPSPLLSNDLLLAQNVPPKAGTPGVVSDSTPAAGGSAPQAGSPLGGFMPLLMMLVIFVPFFLLMSRRQKKEQAARSSLKKGDKITSTSGLLGELVEMDDARGEGEDRPGRHRPAAGEHHFAGGRAPEGLRQGIEGSEGCFGQEVASDPFHRATCPTRTSSPSCAAWRP